MRPGRLDRILYVGPPDFAGRVDILRIRTRNMAVEPALDLDALAALVHPPPVHSIPRLIVHTDERVLGSRNNGYVPGSCLDRYARRY